MDLFEQESIDLEQLKDKTKFNCEECRKEYNSIQGFVSHNNNVHKGEKYKCDDCEKYFTSKEYLRGHKRTVHVIFLWHDIVVVIIAVPPAPAPYSITSR